MGREEEIIKEREKKISELRKKGVNPYAYRFDKKDSVEKALRVKSGTKVKTAGRVMTCRQIGKIMFSDLQDFSGKIQLVFQDKETPAKDFNFFCKYIDIGDIVGVEGKITKTKTGQQSILVKKLTLLTKSLLPLPSKWYGLQDKEERYRKRYLDMIMNPEVKKVFEKRTKVIDAIREFMVKKQYVEVQTPILQPIYGGGFARPFESKLNALDMNVYMRISNEMYLKRLLVGNFEKVFEFSIDFRNEGIDKSHNPEFLLFEAMTAYSDYNDGMVLIEKLTEYVVKKVNGSTKVRYKDKIINFKTPWKRISVRNAIKKYCKIDIEKTSDSELKKIIDKNNIKLEGGYIRGNAIMALIEEFCEKHFIQPTMLYDYPIETSPLSKSKRDNPKYAERFEQYIFSMELGNNYSELNNPRILTENWKKQEEALRKGDKEAQRMDEDFINALEIGMPPTCGIAIGVDRLVMLLTNQSSIKDVIFFPFMRPEEREEKIEEEKTEFKGKKVIISNEAKKLGLKTTYVIIEGVNIKKEDKNLEKEKKNVKNKKFDFNDKRLKSMREAYKKFGVDPTKRTPSSEALIKRLKDGKDLYRVNTLVDSYNLSSIIEKSPMAAYDLRKVNFPIVLREAEDGEEITIIGGDNKKVRKGEIVYADEKDILCLDFNYRDCDKTKITEKTKNVIVFVDGTSDISDKDILKSLDNTCKLITKFNGGKVIEKKLVK